MEKKENNTNTKTQDLSAILSYEEPKTTLVSVKCSHWPLWRPEKSDLNKITCARAAYDAVVNDGAAIDCNLQAMVCIVVLGGFIIRIKLQERKLLMLNVTDNSS